MVLLPGHCVDRVLLGYILILNAALLIWRPAGLWIPLFALHFAVVAAIVGLTAAAQGKESGAIHFCYRWYPQLCFLLFFEEVGILAHFIQPLWLDRFLIAFDCRLFGTHPTVWLQRYSRPWLTEIMQAFYFSYYLMLPSVGGFLYLRKRWREFEKAMCATALGYSLCYVIFYLFPVEGPYHTLVALHQTSLDGGFFAALMDLVERYGRVQGGAFPSAHVVGTLVPWLAARQHARKLAWGMTPFVVGVLLSTVYGRYHYVADVLAGLAVGVTAWIMTSRPFHGHSCLNRPLSCLT